MCHFIKLQFLVCLTVCQRRNFFASRMSLFETLENSTSNSYALFFTFFIFVLFFGRNYARLLVKYHFFMGIATLWSDLDRLNHVSRRLFWAHSKADEFLHRIRVCYFLILDLIVFSETKHLNKIEIFTGAPPCGAIWTN